MINIGLGKIMFPDWCAVSQSWNVFLNLNPTNALYFCAVIPYLI